MRGGAQWLSGRDPEVVGSTSRLTGVHQTRQSLRCVLEQDTFKVLGNAESGVFLRQLLVLYAYIFLLGILIYAKFFSADASQTP